MAESIQSSTSQSSLAPSTPTTSIQDTVHLPHVDHSSAKQRHDRRASFGLLDSARIRLSRDFYSLVRSNSKSRRHSTALAVQAEELDDNEGFLLADYADPMDELALDIAHLDMYPNIAEEDDRQPRSHDSKFYTFIHRPHYRSRAALDAAARRSRSADPVPPLSRSSGSKDQHMRHFSLDDDENVDEEQFHDRNRPKPPTQDPSKPATRSPSRPLSTNTTATNTTITDRRGKLRRSKRPEAIFIPPPPSIGLHSDPLVLGPEQDPTFTKSGPHGSSSQSRDTNDRSRTKSPHPGPGKFAKLLSVLGSPRKASMALPASRPSSPAPNGDRSDHPHSPSVGVHSVPSSPRKERGRGQTCWRFFSGSASRAGSTSTSRANTGVEHAASTSHDHDKRPTTSDGVSSEKAILGDSQRLGPRKSHDVSRRGKAEVVASQPIRPSGLPVHMNGHGHRAPPRVRTSSPRSPGGMGNVSVPERDSIGTEKLGRCSPLFGFGFGFGDRNRDRKGKERDRMKVEVKAVGEPILRDAGKDRNVGRVAAGVERPRMSGGEKGVANGGGRVRRASESSGSKIVIGSPNGNINGHAMTSKRTKHGSFDFERPVSGGSAETSQGVMGGKKPGKERTAGARVVGAPTRNASLRRHPQKIHFESPSEAEEDGNGVSLQRRPTATSANTSRPKAHEYGYSRSQTSMSASGGSASGTGGSWGKSHPPSRQVLQQRHRQLGAFQFEPAVAALATSSISLSQNDPLARTQAHSRIPIGVSGMNLGAYTASAKEATTQSSPRSKGRSLDLGLDLAWAPTKVREEAVLPNSHGLGLRRGKEREEVLMELRGWIGDGGVQRVEKYVHRFNAHQIPLDGPSGLIPRVRKLLDASTLPHYGPRPNERSKKELLGRFTRVVQAGPMPGTP